MAASPYLAASSSHGQLPEGWEEVWDDSHKRTYFYHTLTRMSRWERPSPDLAAEIDARAREQARATEEQVLRRRAELDAIGAAQARATEATGELKRSFEFELRAWAGKRGLAALLGDLQSAHPLAPALDLDDNGRRSAAVVKKAYMKAARALHPDKMQAGSSVAGRSSVVTAPEAAKAEVLFTILASLYEDFKLRAATDC